MEAFNHATKRTSELEKEKEKVLEKVCHAACRRLSPFYMMTLEFVLIEIEAEIYQLDKTVRGYLTMITALEKMKKIPNKEGQGWCWCVEW